METSKKRKFISKICNFLIFFSSPFFHDQLFKKKKKTLNFCVFLAFLT